MKHIARTVVEAFDYVASSRLANSISTDFSEHLINFLKLGTPCNLPDCQHGEVVRLDDLMQNHHMSNADHADQDLHDVLHSYYKVALKRFVDSLRMQAADCYLITGSETPLALFSPAFVAGMTPGQLEEVAGEDLTIRRRRLQLEKEQRDLEDGKKITS